MQKNNTYYIDGLLRQANAAYARKYLGLGYDDAVTFGYVTNTTPIWQDVRIPLSATAKPTANPARLQAFIDTTQAWQFSPTTTESVCWELQLPHGINSAYGIRLHVHWTATALVAVGLVRWGIEYTRAPVGEIFNNPTLTVSATNPAAVAAGEHAICPIVQLLNPGESEVIVGRLFRDSADGYAGQVFGLSLDAHYVVQKTGSLEEMGD